MKLLEESEHSSSLSEKLRDSSPSNELSFDRRPSLKIGGSDIESADSLEDDVLPPVASVKELAIATAGLAGCQFCWGIQVGYGSKTFEELGMPAAFVSWAWLAGPISGILVQPIVGTISDRYVSKLGKRKPFVLIGLVCVLVSLLLFSHSDVIGQRLGDSKFDVQCSIQSSSADHFFLIF